VIKVIAGDANTNQRFAAWKVPASTVLNFGQPTVPTKPTQIRWGIVARTVSGAAGSLAVQTVGNSGSTSLSYPVAGALDCIEVMEDGVPPQWTGNRTTVPPGIRITPAQDPYILGIYMIEEPRNVLESAYLGRASGRKVPVAKGVATGICKVTCERNNSGFVHVKFRNSATIRGGNQGYCYDNGEWSIAFSSHGGVPKLVGSVQQLWKTQDSVNAGVHDRRRRDRRGLRLGTDDLGGVHRQRLQRRQRQRMHRLLGVRGAGRRRPLGGADGDAGCARRRAGRPRHDLGADTFARANRRRCIEPLALGVAEQVSDCRPITLSMPSGTGLSQVVDTCCAGSVRLSVPLTR
jgi:hypothetical protein